MKKLKQIPWISFKKSGQPMIKSNDIESFSKQLTALTTRWSFKKLRKIEKKKLMHLLKSSCQSPKNLITLKQLGSN